MIQKFKRKPVAVEAIQFNNLNHDEISSFFGEKLEREVESDAAWKAGVAPPVSSIKIGEVKAFPGYWFIKDPDGRVRVCKPDVFENNYERDGNSVAIEALESIAKGAPYPQSIAVNALKDIELSQQKS